MRFNELIQKEAVKRSRGYCGRVYPDGSFSVGWDSANYSIERKESQDHSRMHALQTYQDLDEFGNISTSVPLDWAIACGWSDALGQEKQLNLGLSTLTIPRKRARKGLKGITSHGKRMVRSGAALLEKKYGRRRLAMLTVTIPPLGEINDRLIAMYWGELMKAYIGEIKREFTRVTSCPFEFVYCTEIQPSRYRRSGSVGLHAHFVYVCRGIRGGFYASASWFRSCLQRVLGNVLARAASDTQLDGGVQPEIDTSAAIDTSVIRKSAAKYLGKYMSKGGVLVAEIAASSLRDCLPYQWWGISAGLRACVRQGIRTLSREFCDWLVNRTADGIFLGVLRWARHVILSFERGDQIEAEGIHERHRFLAGVVGFLDDAWMQKNIPPISGQA